MRPFILAETNWKTVRDAKIELAILPWGATEAHNYHLPYGTDNILAEKIAIASAQLAWGKKARLIVLPTIPFGVNTGQSDIKLDINLNPSTQLIILNDIVDTLNRQNIRKLLIVNGHGGNDFKQIIRETGLKYPDMFICNCNWYQSFNMFDFFENDGDHAGEMETSIMLYIAPELVLSLKEAGKGISKRFKIAALNEKWAWAERRWSKITTDTGIGNPLKSNPEKGEKCFSAIVSKVSGLMVALSVADIDNLYEE